MQPRSQQSSHNWRDKAWYLPIGVWNKIHLLRSSDGHVPLQSTNLLDHANRKMVKQGVPKIHQETSTGVLARYLLKNHQSTVVQTCSKPNRNEPDGEHSWRLVFIADGIS